MRGPVMSKPSKHTLAIIHKEINLAASFVMYDRPFTPATLETDWHIRGGKWHVQDGWLCGENPLNSPGMVTCRKQLLGNVMLDFEARTVLPSTHDIDCMWNGSWNETTNERGLAYVVGLEGWWEGKVGFEKSPEYKLGAATPLFDFKPSKTYHIQAGSIDGHVFAFVDGKLLLECFDPTPIDITRYGMIGFEAYASKIQVRNLIVRQIAWTAREQSYAAEF